MTGAYVSRRRAEEFDALVSSRTRKQDATYAPLLDVVDELRAVPQVDARPEFVADLRSQLVVEAARLARPATDRDLRLRLTPKQRQGARERRIATVLGGFAIVAASGSMAMASQAALPGDALYPVKRALENAETNLQSDDAAKAQKIIEHAQQRLIEAEQLSAEGADAETVAETLQDFTDQSNQATDLALDDYEQTGDEQAIGDLRSFAEQSMGDLDNLGDVVPDDARAALITAAQSVQQADSAAFQVCPTCGEGGVTELPEFATAPVSLNTPLLTGEDSVLSIELPAFAERVEKVADKTPQNVKPDDRQQDEQDDPTTVTEPDPTTDPVTDGLDKIGDKIKDDLGGDDDGGASGGDDLLGDTIDGVVGGVTGLVDGLLGAP